MLIHKKKCLPNYRKALIAIYLIIPSYHCEIIAIIVIEMILMVCFVIIVEQIFKINNKYPNIFLNN